MWKILFKNFLRGLSSKFTKQKKKKKIVTREIQYFELEIFSFNSYVYYLTRGFVASTLAFNLPTRAFSLPIRAFNLATRALSVLTRGSELITHEFELVTCVDLNS